MATRRIFCLTLAVLLGGASVLSCTSGGGGGGLGLLPSIEGNAVKGPVADAEIRVFYFDSLGVEVEIPAANAPVYTDQDGSFDFQVHTSDIAGVYSPLIVRTMGGTMGGVVAPTLEGVIPDPVALTYDQVTLACNLSMASSVAAGLLRALASDLGTNPQFPDAVRIVSQVEEELGVDLSDDPAEGEMSVAQVNACVDQNLDLILNPANNPAVDDLIDYFVANLRSSSGALDDWMEDPTVPGTDIPASFEPFGMLPYIFPDGPFTYVDFALDSDKDYIENDASDAVRITATLRDATGFPIPGEYDIRIDIVSGPGTVEVLYPPPASGSLEILVTSDQAGDTVLDLSYDLWLTNPYSSNTVTHTITIPAVDLVTDTDGDGLADGYETLGWTIVVDRSGYGDAANGQMLVIYEQTSDITLADTDGDGLSDFEEFQIRSDPRSADTDWDGLTDHEEWTRWMTNPNSVDTDADSRGPDHDQAPNQLLFDGTELSLLRTSPTLDDTDGDGRTDCEESDDPFRSPLVSDLPKLDVSIVDTIDVRLDVVYAEEQGQTRQYGTEISRSQTQSTTQSHSHSVGASLTIGSEATVGLTDASVSYKTEFTVSTEHTYSASYESSKTSQESYSEYTTDSRTRTETVASGSMSMGIRLSNPGDITYTVTDFGITVRQWLPGSDPTSPGAFKTLATLTPALGGGITLAPGAESPVLQVEATDLNASRVKDFLARPDSLYLEPAYYELENAEGMNFAFLEEITGPRTAWVLIDYGDGTTEEYRVATNVNRDPGGSWAGVTLGEIMNEILGIPCTTRPRQQLDPGASTNELVLHSVRGVATNPDPSRGFWIVVVGSETQPEVGTAFQNITLHGKENVLLLYVRDDDGDGLYAPEEQHYRTDDGATLDTDGDGLNDVDEIRGETFVDGEGNEIPCGWVVTLDAQDAVPYPVVSDPVNPDQDGDGLDDLEEKTGGTDPALADTDRDGIDDLADPWPLNPAAVLYVWEEATGANDGTGWADAYVDLQDALDEARAGAATTAEPDDDVAEIWVAAGTYVPTTTAGDRAASFELVDFVGVYGGFSGIETKRSQRSRDPLTNGAVLSGDIDAPGDSSDNSYHVVRVDETIRDSAILDGFMISGGFNDSSVSGDPGGGGMWCRGWPTLRNLVFLENQADRRGGGLFFDPQPDPESKPFRLTISGCAFIRNSSTGQTTAGTYGGAIYESASLNGSMTIENCVFIENRAGDNVDNAAVNHHGGAIYSYGPCELIVTGCVFNVNRIEELDDYDAHARGGAIAKVYGKAWMRNCRFTNNTSHEYGGALFGDEAEIVIAQCTFWENTAQHYHGGGGFLIDCSLWVINSTFSKNSAGEDSTDFYGGGLRLEGSDAYAFIDNSIFYGNTSDAAHTAYDQISIYPSSNLYRVKLRFSCLEGIEQIDPWNGNGCIGSDPLFKDADQGDLRLSSGSPCIDSANNYVDYDPMEVGFQILPDTDLSGYWRIVDGNGDGEAVVDMGPYEYHGN